MYKNGNYINIYIIEKKMKGIKGMLMILLISQSVICSPKKINTDFLNLLSSKTNVLSS